MHWNHRSAKFRACSLQMIRKRYIIFSWTYLQPAILEEMWFWFLYTVSLLEMRPWSSFTSFSRKETAGEKEPSKHRTILGIKAVRFLWLEDHCCCRWVKAKVWKESFHTSFSTKGMWQYTPLLQQVHLFGKRSIRIASNVILLDKESLLANLI